jgi:hypothetical protein
VPNGTSCGSESCSGDTHTNPTCSSGTCNSNSSSCPGSYVCANGTVCQSCSDGSKNGAETDVDCGGGGPCPKCGSNKLCNGDSDCVSGNCNGNPKRCQ